MQSYSLLEKLTKGWLFPYRSKAWHYFDNRVSLCGKHNITEYAEGGLLPCLNGFDRKCKKCLEKLNN